MGGGKGGGMTDLSGFLCLGSILLVPIVAFVVGFLVGRDKLPFKIRIERNRRARFAVEDSHEVAGE